MLRLIKARSNAVRGGILGKLFIKMSVLEKVKVIRYCSHFTQQSSGNRESVRKKRLKAKDGRSEVL